MRWLMIIFLLGTVRAAFTTPETNDSISTTTEEPKHPGTYLIVAPSVVRPGLPYAVSVNILQSTSQKETVRLEIRTSDNVTIASKVAKNFKKGVPQTLKIATLPADKLITDTDYKVYVRGETSDGTVLFENEKSVQFNQKSLSVFIQTDKGIYKPGETVKYRIVIVSPELLPSNRTVSVRIIDPNQNLIKLDENKKLSKGVLSNELELASEPPFGEWTIEATPQGADKISKTFTVDQYVLPKFEVTVKPPSFMTTNQDLKIVVSAIYTYGKGVSGKAKALVKPAWSWREDGNNSRIEKTATLNLMGEAIFTFSNNELKDHELLQRWGGSIQIDATVTEDLTGVERNGTATINADRVGVKFDIQKQGDNFKPGLPFTFFIALKQMDDTPIIANAVKDVQLVTVFQYPYDANVTEQPNERGVKNVTLSADGTITYTVTPPLNCSSFYIEALYDTSGKGKFTGDDAVSNTVYVGATKSPSGTFIQVKPNNEGKVTAGESVSFTVKATGDIRFITYQVMSRGSIVLSKEIVVNTDHSKISFPTTNQMAPKSRLIVYSIHESNQEILVDSVDFQVDGLFRNNVTFSLDKSEAEPGDSVSFTVQADPGSFIGLGAVDQSVLLLRSGNDITRELVENDIAQYDTTTSSYSGPRFARRKRSIWFPHASGQDADTIFENAGLVVLTDAYLYREPALIFMPFMASEGMPVLASQSVHAKDLQETSSSTAPRLRTKFPETWLWTDVETNTIGHLMENPGCPFCLMPLGAPGALGPMEPVPQAAPVAATSDGATTTAQTPPRVRTEFPETWLWSDGETDENGIAVFNTTAPDTITSWVASVFAISDNTGLGVAPGTQKLRVFRPFFVRLELPYSVKRGEKFALQVLVFNYMDKEQEVTVTLAHEEGSGFDFINKNGSIATSVEKNLNTRITSVPGGGASKAVYFPIIPNQLGDISLQVTAVSGEAGDAVKMPLKVEPEGYRVDRNVPVVVSLNGSDSINRDVTLNWPTDYVNGSRTAKIDVIGDIMGPVLSNIDNLVRMPYGCGEQNMLNFVPNIVVMNYLNVTDRHEPQLEAKAKKYMESGYQRELTYKRKDNSFSAFGNSDTNGSTWLTAFVVRSFAQAKPFIFVDQSVINSSIEFLNDQQLESGAFAEHGEVIHKDMQGGASAGGLALTAYVTIAMLENDVQNAKAVAYIENQLPTIGNDSYTLAVVTYALFLADSSKAADAMKTLNQLKIADNDGTVHWSSEKGGPNKINDTEGYFFQPRPVDVETTAYALLSVLLEGNTNEGLPIVRWLTAQRNSLGGFSSTQDTVVALQALAAYAQLAYSPESDVTIDVINGNDSHKFIVNNANSIVLQSYELHNMDSPVEARATGRGTVFIQIAYSYYRNTLKKDNAFFCIQKVKELRDGNRLELDLCCNYTRSGESNMAVAEVSTLSGYRYDEEDLEYLTNTPGIQRKEFEQDDTKINIYFSPIGAEPVCFSLVSDLVYQVADQKPAQIHIFDYYNPEDQLKATYTSNGVPSLTKSCPDCW